MVELPEALITRLTITARIASVAAVLSLVLRAAVLFRFWMPPFAVSLAIEVLWTIGVVLFAAPIEDPDAEKRGLGRRSPVRVAARWLQLAWPVSVLLAQPALLKLPVKLHEASEWTGRGMALAGLAGLLALAVHLRRWAEWLEDDDSARWAEYYLWSVAGVPGFLLLALLAAAVSPPFLVGPLLGVGACLLAMLILLPGALLGVTRSLGWSRSWKQLRAERDAELRDALADRPPDVPRTTTSDDAPIPLVEETGRPSIRATRTGITPPRSDSAPG